MAAILLFCIVQKYYLKNSCIFFQVLLPHVISERKKVTGTIGTLTLENHALPIIIIIIIIIVSCHRPFLPGTSLEPAVIPTAQASSVTLQYFPYYV
jgi:K+-transporting ATPase A subunit